jgi:hypothetical protein
MSNHDKLSFSLIAKGQSSMRMQTLDQCQLSHLQQYIWHTLLYLFNEVCHVVNSFLLSTGFPSDSAWAFFRSLWFAYPPACIWEATWKGLRLNRCKNWLLVHKLCWEANVHNHKNFIDYMCNLKHFMLQQSMGRRKRWINSTITESKRITHSGLKGYRGNALHRL